jgi:hypothetical protein
MPALPNGNASAVVGFDGRVGGGEGGPVRPHLVRQRRRREPEQQPARRSRPAGGSRQFAAELLGKLPRPTNRGGTGLASNSGRRQRRDGVCCSPLSGKLAGSVATATTAPAVVAGAITQVGGGGLGLGPPPTGLPGSKFTLPTLAARLGHG